MGGVLSSVFGGSTSNQSANSTSSNQAYGTLSNLLSGNISQGNSAMSTLSGLLGLGGAAGSTAAQGSLTNFLNSAGYNFTKQQGDTAATGSAAANGLLNSGATSKALANYNSNLASTGLNNYVQNLSSLGSYGQQSASTLAGAGQQSSSSSTGTSDSSKGIFNTLFPGGLSDRRLKHSFRHLGTNDQGIHIYEFQFKHRPGDVHVGVIAQQVEKVLPAAMGPRYGTPKYRTVNYSKITPLPNHPFTMYVQELTHG